MARLTYCGVHSRSLSTKIICFEKSFQIEASCSEVNAIIEPLFIKDAMGFLLINSAIQLGGITNQQQRTTYNLNSCSLPMRECKQDSWQVQKPGVCHGRVGRSKA